MQHKSHFSKPRRCDFCAEFGHVWTQCPHMHEQLLDPSPRGAALRGLVTQLEVIANPDTPPLMIKNPDA